MQDSTRIFEQFKRATMIRSADTWYFALVDDWDAKRLGLAVQLTDIPNLISDFMDRRIEPVDGSDSMSVFDATPSYRLAAACEAATNALYGIAEIAAQFANRVSGTLPSSFNKLRKKIRVNEIDDPALVEALGDLQWYERVRELRTEWSHYSTVYVGLRGDLPLLIVKGYRQAIDREHLGKRSEILVPEVFNWTSDAIKILDRFAGYLLHKYVIPKFDRTQTIENMIRDTNGFPARNPDGSFKVESVTIDKLLRDIGI